MTLTKTLDAEELREYEESNVRGTRKFDYSADVLFALGTGLAISAAATNQHLWFFLGGYVSLVGASLRFATGYSKLYCHPKNKDLRERIESGEKVSLMEFLKRRTKTEEG